MIATRAHTLALADDIRRALTQAEVPALVTTTVTEATPSILDGTPAVVLAPPKATDKGPAYELTWEIPIVGAPVGDEDAAWDALDTILSALDALTGWETLDPITWAGSQTTQAPAYLLTLTRTALKE